MVSQVRLPGNTTNKLNVIRSSAVQPKAVVDAKVQEKNVDGAEISTEAMGLQELLAATAEEARSLEEKIGPHEKGEVIVRLKGGFNLQSEEDFLKKFGAKLIYKFDIPREIYKSIDGDMLHVKLPEGMTVAQAIAAMEKDPRVEYVVPNNIYKLEGKAAPVIPDDLDERLWGLHNTGQNGGTPDADIDAPEAWAVTTGVGKEGNGPVIAVIDTGIDLNHPDLVDNIWTNPNEVPDGTDTDGNGVVDDIHGYNALDDNGTPQDGHSHGTHVSGTIAAKGNNGQGVVGVNWNAQIMPVKIFSDSGSTNAAAIVRGILYATRMGARITSNSWGGGSPNQAIRDAFAESPALHIMAAGNSGTDNDRSPHYPSSYDLPNIVAVAATDRNDQLASFSCYGAKSVDLAAPGVDIYSTVPGGYGTKSGTSMATPHVSGAAVLIASLYPDATNDEIKARLLNGVDHLPQLQGKVLSGGRLNIANALENDHLAPAAPNDFGVAEAKTNGVTLRWTATGDDGWCGDASAYELKVADKPIVEGPAGEGQISWDDARSVPVGRPNSTGTIEQVEVPVNPSGKDKTLYFALKVVDNVGNRSEMRTTTATVPAAHVAFEDDVEAGNKGWTSTGTWGIVEDGQGGHVWTDSPDGKYGNKENSTLTSPVISLENFSNATLMFDAKYDLENRYDNVRVEISPDGENWVKVDNFTGKSEGWETHSVDLSRYDGQSVQVRFHLQSDASVNADGFYLDNVVVLGDQKESQDPGQG